jgi:CRISPR system Cascade subunit CasC
MLFEIHMLKNYPPSNLNRDETGSPKSCYFGGTQRGRISSQCLKRSWRTSPLFSDLLGEKGWRTRKLPELVGAELEKREIPAEIIEILVDKTTGIGNKDGKENDGRITKQIVFFSDYDVVAIADLMEEAYRVTAECDKKKLKDIKASDIAKKIARNRYRPITVDIALFGRMVTSDAFADVESSVQTAHAISTHQVNQESDYFTAVDDLLKSDEEEQGAAMIGDVDYNACCYYHYVAIDTDQLKENLKDSPDVMKNVKDLLSAFVQIVAFSNPSGKQNTFAGNVLPDLICVEVKEKKIPVNYVNAFVEPVRFTGQRQLVQESAKKLVGEINKIDKVFELDIKDRIWLSVGNEQLAPDKASRVSSLKEMMKLCENWIIT